MQNIFSSDISVIADNFDIFDNSIISYNSDISVISDNSDIFDNSIYIIKQDIRIYVP